MSQKIFQFQKIIRNFFKYKKEENEKEKVIQKLGQIRMVLKEYDPIRKYSDYKRNIYKINEIFIMLNFIKRFS